MVGAVLDRFNEFVGVERCSDGNYLIMEANRGKVIQWDRYRASAIDGFGEELDSCRLGEFGWSILRGKILYYIDCVHFGSDFIRGVLKSRGVI
jgi:hypothetical protein